MHSVVKVLKVLYIDKPASEVLVDPPPVHEPECGSSISLRARLWMCCRCVIIIIISLFQANNIFGTSASLTYGPQLQSSL